MTTAPTPAPVPKAGPAPPSLRRLRRAVITVLVLVAAFQVATWAFHGLKSLLGTLFLAWLFAISMEPVVGALARRGMRRGLATGLVLLGLALGVAAFSAVFGALLVEQVAGLVRAVPDAVDTVVAWLNRSFKLSIRPQDVLSSVQLNRAEAQALAGKLTGGVLGLVSSVVGLLFQALTLLLFAFYLSAEAPRVRAAVSSWFPPAQQRVIARVWEIAVAKTGGYVVSRLILAALSAFFTGLFLLLIGVPSWLPLALFVGLVSQFVPTVGTYIALALPALVAVLEQPVDALWVIIFGTAYQQVENYLFAPRVTARTVEIHPAVAFGAVLAGAALFGPLGALVSIPVVAAGQALAETYGRRFDLVEAGDAAAAEADAAVAAEAAAEAKAAADTAAGAAAAVRPAAP